MDKVLESMNKLMGEVKSLEDLAGRQFVKVEQLDDDELRFYLTEKNYLRMYHSQDCCESVTIEDICGDLDDLVDAYIVHFEERISHDEDDRDYESATWTFYDIQTTKGCVNIRWLGESNGYYSESVYLEFVGE